MTATTTTRRVLAVAGTAGATMLMQLVVFGAFMRLFDGANADLVPGVAPLVLFVSYAGALVVTGGWTLSRYGGRALPLSSGLGVLVAASLPFGGGCEVASGGGDVWSLLPGAELHGLSLVFQSGTGCTYPVVVPLLAVGYTLFVGGLWVVSDDDGSGVKGPIALQ